MSVQHLADLQAGIYQALINYGPLSALVGEQIYDAVPSGTSATTYVLIGEEKTFDRGDITHGATRHDLIVNVVSNASGFSDAKRIANEVCAALEDTPVSLGSGTVRRVQFRSAKVRRDTGAGERRIDLTFRVLVDHT